MISVQEAEKIILEQATGYGTTDLPFEQALGHVLAADILADRDLPPCNRSTMDGIAISFNAFLDGIRSFAITAVQAASDEPVILSAPGDCIEIMTGAAIAAPADTVIRYEDISIQNGVAILQTDAVRQGQNIHEQGADKKAGEVIVSAPAIITPAIIGAAAFTGYTRLTVKKQPSVMLFSNGDELMEVSETPPSYKIRRSNTYALAAALRPHSLLAGNRHLPDDEEAIEQAIGEALNKYDVIMMSGGVSMGKYDLVAKVLEKLSVRPLFHKVKQRPGKPFWFGIHGQGATVFAFPGNPVSAFMCFHRYFLPWYRASMGIANEQCYAMLAADITFMPPLQYFLQVRLQLGVTGQLLATPVEGNGSGDLANMTVADAFMELPLELDNFKKGDVYPIWPVRPIFI